ncbi:hypothetical protein KL86SPO_31313 [uncultured Sporomusa sp.]|uniref:Uncharacterized protein n=1 Tax=uncultured Sporomusa sp. TaxID=307249 RepID=A0A212LU39_9FIRM|nr:hypothetical protein KL86SPO_31313 [uncultured Sporomusa sp.]
MHKGNCFIMVIICDLLLFLRTKTKKDCFHSPFLIYVLLCCHAKKQLHFFVMF